MLLVFQLFILFLIAIFIISQIILPSFNNNYIYFWLFRKKIHQVIEVENELQNTKYDTVLIKLKGKVKKYKDKNKELEKDLLNPKINGES